ncbi:MAG: chemotaxis protein CheW [Acidobacteriota bacterium]
MLNKKENNQNREHLASTLERLKRAIEAAQAPAALSQFEKKNILKKRAEKLAERVTVSEVKNEIEVIEFTLSGETYAIETSFLKEVFHMKEITPVPLTPAFVKGIINLRGNIVSVLDLKVVFELANGTISNYDRVIILQERDMTFGILADEIRGIKKISLENSTFDLPDLNAVKKKYLKAVTSQRVVILDGSKLLNDESIIINDL